MNKITRFILLLGAVLTITASAPAQGVIWSGPAMTFSNAPGSDWTQSIVFAILILILVFRPEGLLGERTPEGG